MIALEIVPTASRSLREIEARNLAELWIRQARELAVKEVLLTDIFTRSFITPRCWLDKIDEELAIRAMDLTIMVSNILRVIFDNFNTN